MAKTQQRNKQTLAVNQTAIGHQIEESTFYDDSLLPDVSEVERYYTMDSSIVEWIKDKAAKEQDYRHKSLSERTEVVRKNEKRSFALNLMGLIFAFIFLCGGLFGSIYLILMGCSTTGFIFTGITLLMGGALLSGRKMPRINTNVDPKTLGKN